MDRSIVYFNFYFCKQKNSLSLEKYLLCCDFSAFAHCIAENGPRLSVSTDQPKVVSRRGGNATLSCKIQRDQSLAPNRKMRIKWTKMTSDYLKEVEQDKY